MAQAGPGIRSPASTSTWSGDDSAPRIPYLRPLGDPDPASDARMSGTRLRLDDALPVLQAPNGGPGPAASFLASLIAPGSSQWMHGQRRTYLYLGLELAGWIGFFQGRYQGADYRSAYRDVALTHAALESDPDGFTGGFGFYETLGQWTTSGQWDAEPATEGLQPETDPETYNGNIWSLASDLYLSGEGSGSDPDAMQMALLYYRERAYSPEQSWDWSGNSAQLDRYRDLIERSDDSFRRATVILGAVVANHLLSAVDAFLSTRISSERAVRLSSDTRPFGRSRAMRWTFELSLNPFP